MKIIRLFMLPALIIAFSMTNVYSQTGGLEKTEILKAMNSFEGLDIGADKQEKIKETNKGIVDNIFDIANGNDSADEKMIKFKDLQKKNSSVFEDILGVDTFKQYKKNVKKKLKPYKRKAKLVGFLI
ncbi:hypothetical protein [Fulvivirga sedimenti]|uniref:DUF3347 domain-containing protein n=1 Tax=Fulvivirga sedimenti TaxID=2879465 RepID=A0A9X1L366_9BACT|nr:hypothetical protein [Fulvivirga sedimenti]MCA6078946.1 hypothetical protein [Fulvivirga sedimenti]